jgi:exopolyphosphatase/guanosine-5'-triphosphate,3'-diphosphate pyrophosphatase
VRIAALDVGSNSFHLVVVDVDGQERGPWRALERAKEMVRLGESTLVTGEIAPEKLAASLRALERLRAVVDRHQPDAVLAVATSAVREARNGRALVELARAQAGFDVRVIDGEEEARLVFLGACDALAPGERRVLLFDLGGGSTEVAVGTGAGPELVRSLPIGVLRLLDEWGGADPPSPEHVAAARARVRRIAEPTVVEARERGFDYVALTSGTAQALLRLAFLQGFDLTSPDRQTVLSRASLEFLQQQLAGLTRAGRAALPGIEERRADTILTGAIALATLLELTGADRAVVCGSALREGVIRDYLNQRAR